MIRPLVEADLAHLAPALAGLDLMRRYGRTAAALEADLRAALTRGDGLLVHEEGGLAWFHPTGTFGALGGYLRLIAVTGGTGKGIGAALLEAYERAVTARHAFLLVSAFNTDAQRFYERHGYRRIGAIPEPVLASVDELVYHKKLR